MLMGKLVNQTNTLIIHQQDACYVLNELGRRQKNSLLFGKLRTDTL